MYKVLLVDDEYMVTEGLKRLIPLISGIWRSSQQLGHADEALGNMFRKILSMWSFPMSICLTKQGLIRIREMKEIFTRCRLYPALCYQEFDYVKKSNEP